MEQIGIFSSAKREQKLSDLGDNLEQLSQTIRGSGRPQGHTKNVFMIFFQPA